MNNIVGLTVFALGIVLLIFGLTAIPSPGGNASQLSNTHSAWMLVGGAVAVIGGLVLAIFGRRT